MKMQKAEMEFVAFDAQDVIATSGGYPTFTFAGLFNNKTGDATITLNDGTVIYNAANYSSPEARNNAAKNALNTALKTSDVTLNTRFEYNDENAMPLNALFSMEGDGNAFSHTPDFNGIYKWIAEHRCFRWIQ